MSAVGTAAQIFRDIIEANRYLVLATADAHGRPWSSPVYFAHDRYTEFLWVSSPQATHSSNIAVRPEVGIVVFDSQSAINTGQGAYTSAVAQQLDDDEASTAIKILSRRSVSDGGREWTSKDVRYAAGIRLYRATADSHWILAKDGQPDHRIPVTLTGTTVRTKASE